VILMLKTSKKLLSLFLFSLSKTKKNNLKFKRKL
jgi:hypothetical protein